MQALLDLTFATSTNLVSSSSQLTQLNELAHPADRADPLEWAKTELRLAAIYFIQLLYIGINHSLWYLVIQPNNPKDKVTLEKSSTLPTVH